MRKKLSFMLAGILTILFSCMPVVETKADDVAYYAHENVTYYTYEMLQYDLGVLKQRYGDKVTTKSVGKSVEGREIYEIIVGNPNANKAIFVQSSMHAREYINSQVTMSIVDIILQSDLKNTCFYVLPMVNPDGVVRSQTVRELKKVKANANGIDLNRQFPQGWETAPTSGERYRGAASLTEPEAVILANTVLERNFQFVINYHSMGNLVYYGSVFGTETSNEAGRIHATNISKMLGYKPIQCDGKECGTFGDYLGAHNIPYVTIENGVSACPVKQSEFAKIRDKNLLVWQAVID